MRVRRTVALFVGLAAALSGGSVATAAAATPAPSARLVVIAVPDLRWTDVAAMPTLQSFLADASVGELSVKTSGGVPRCAPAIGTFSAGNRASAPTDLITCDLSSAQLTAMRSVSEHDRFGARVGAFGDALRGAGLTTAAVGPAAAALLADSTGAVDVRTEQLGAAVARADVVAVFDQQLNRANESDRAGAESQLDTILGRQLAAVPPGTTTVVAGISDGALTGMHLHVLGIRGAGWPHRELRSASTRAPYVQLIDLAPTLLHLLHVPVPSAMVGSVAYPTDALVKSAAAYADDDDHAITALRVGAQFRSGLAEFGILVLLLLIAATVRPRLRRPATLLARLLAGIPAGCYLAELFPWWRWGSWPYFALVAAAAVVIAVVTTVALRAGPAVAIATVAGVTAAVLLADQLAGAPLQLSAPLGDNPLVAGRFHGMGNNAFAFMCAGVIVVAGVLAGRLRSAGRTRLALAAAALLCLVAIVVDAAPALGDDFGGLLTMVPATVVLLCLVARVRLTWRRIGAVIGLVLVVAVAVALLDYSRPVAEQTHVGRFVGDVLHGGAWTVVRRKFDASIRSFGNVALSAFLLVVIVGAIAGRDRVRSALGQVAGLTEAAVAVAVLAVLGTFLNDSGVVVAAAALVVFVGAVAGAGVGAGVIAEVDETDERRGAAVP